jgi:hypothetical protein
MHTNRGAAARTEARSANIAQPDLELVAVPRDESFKVWSHGYPYRTVRWHFHPEYEIHLITSTTGKFFVGDHIGSFEHGNLVMTGSNLPHNWVSSVPQETRVDERCLVLQFDAEFAARAITAFPELKRVEPLLDASRWGVLFTPKTGMAAEPIMREMLGAQGIRRITLFIALLDLLLQSTEQVKLASAAYRSDPASYAETHINHVLAYIGKNLSQELRETELAELAGQSVSAFSRSSGCGFLGESHRLCVDSPMVQEVVDVARCSSPNDGVMREVIRMTSVSAITARSAGNATRDLDVGSVPAVVPKIDHRVGERLERVVHVADAFEAQQQTAKLVLPGKDAFDGSEALLEDRRVKVLLAPAFRRFAPARVLGDVRGHAAIEDRAAVGPAIVDPIQADG